MLKFEAIKKSIKLFNSRFMNYLSFKQLACCLFLCFSFGLSAQHNHPTPPRNCHAMDVLQQQQQADPAIQQRMQNIEQHTQNYIRSGQANSSSRSVITIPVVVHVIYNTSAQNISDAQILSQIQVLNDDFRRTNADANNTWSQAADSEIEFCLATVDPNGNATTGITRTSTSVSSFSTNDAMKYSSQGGKDAWPRDQYLNMWVCNIGGGILGYAQFPGSGSAATDGVVMGYKYFGTVGQATAPFDGGRTATHEVGHWLNLRHIWGDGGCGVDDFVDDTPKSDAANYGCSTGHSSCGSTDMVQNYMDYSDDACMNLFTAGQKARMRALFAPGGFRESLLSSNGCGGSTGGGTTFCSTAISSFPYTQGFESGLGDWSQSSSDDIDWTQNSGGTASSSTGPSAASEATNYLYIEASSPNYPSKVAILNAPCFDLAAVANPEFSFDYHMYGAAMGTLSLQASTDGSSWTTLWTTSSNQGNSWLSATADLSAYVGEVVQLRFYGSTGTSYTSDIAIDNIRLEDADGSTGGGCDETVSLTINFDNYPGETSWEIIDASSTVVASGDNYSGSSHNENVCLSSGCYDFVIYDSYGDGICCSYGSGSYSLTNAQGDVLASGASFGSSETTNFCLSNNRIAANVTTTEDFSVSLYPNPAREQLNVELNSQGVVNAQIFDAMGRQIWSGQLQNGQHNIALDQLTDGLYYFTAVQADGQQIKQKFVKIN